MMQSLQTAPIGWEERQRGKRKSESEREVFLDTIYVTRITLVARMHRLFSDNARNRRVPKGLKRSFGLSTR